MSHITKYPRSDPQLESASAIWKLTDIANYKLGGYWPNAGSRALIGGGLAPAESNVIDYVTLSSTGNATDFGNLQSTKYNMGSSGNGHRGIFMGGFDGYPTEINVIDYVTISSTGNAADFGNLSVAAAVTRGASNDTRALHMGGGDASSSVGYSNVTDFFFMSSTGNAFDFGDLTLARGQAGSVNSSTRAILGGGTSGTPASNTKGDVIDYVEIATTGNASDFGNLTVAKGYLAGCSSSVRGVFCGGQAPSNTNVLEYITMASTGNAADFGDASAVSSRNCATSNSKRGIFMPGDNPDNRNIIDYFTIATTGNASDFGDLSVARANAVATSDSHGGLSGGSSRDAFLT